MLQKTLGIVLHTLKYKDTSLIADIYTEVAAGLPSWCPYPVRARRR